MVKYLFYLILHCKLYNKNIYREINYFYCYIEYYFLRIIILSFNNNNWTKHFILYLYYINWVCINLVIQVWPYHIKFMINIIFLFTRKYLSFKESIVLTVVQKLNENVSVIWVFLTIFDLQRQVKNILIFF